VTKAFVNDKKSKRAKVIGNVARRDSNENVAAVVAPSNLIQIKCGPTRDIKSAPTSFNGSTNLNPTLDINVSLPVGVALNSDEGSDRSGDEPSCDRKERRLLQNRKSAQKCRQKKKALIGCLKDRFNDINRENEDLKFQIQSITLMLYQKIDENSILMN